MAIGTKSNMVIYEEEFFAGAWETIEQNVNAFNAASRNSIRLVPTNHRGDLLKKSFFKNVSGGLINRRDTTAVTSVTSAALTMDDNKSPKLARRIGPVEDTIDAFKKIAEDPALFSFILGQQTGPEMFQDHLNTAILAADAAISGNANLTHTAAAALDTSDLVDGISKFGDRAGRIACWVMHSTPFYALMKNQIADNLTNLSDVIVFGGGPATLGKPVVLTDSTDLVIPGTTTNYVTLGLVPDGVIIHESEDRTMADETVTGLENLTIRIQGEYSITVEIKGFDYTGGVNPTDATLGTSGNWSQTMSNRKSTAGIRIVSQ